MRYLIPAILFLGFAPIILILVLEKFFPERYRQWQTRSALRQARRKRRTSKLEMYSVVGVLVLIWSFFIGRGKIDLETIIISYFAVMIPFVIGRFYENRFDQQKLNDICPGVGDMIKKEQ